MARIRQVILRRNNDTIQIDSAQWAKMLLYLSKNGWKPGVPTYCFLGTLNVSGSDAQKLSDSGQAILNRVLADPFSVFPIPFDMGKFAEIITFCGEDEFSIY